VDEHKPLPHGSIAGLNCFGFGGANVHVVLQSHCDPHAVAEEQLISPDVPRLVNFSGRTEAAVADTLEYLEKSPMDLSHVALVQEIFASPIPFHPYRGFTILGANGDTMREVEPVPTAKRPLWFCFAGMGTQWVGMGRDMCRLPVFEKTIRKCSEALVPYGMDLYDLILSGTETECNNTLNAFVAIAAIQVALTETLNAMGIHPDGIVGHSVGELACAYSDGTLTPEQTVSAAYWRGKHPHILEHQRARVRIPHQACKFLSLYPHSSLLKEVPQLSLIKQGRLKVYEIIAVNGTAVSYLMYCM
jgi:fatty acid synthase